MAYNVYHLSRYGQHSGKGVGESYRYPPVTLERNDCFLSFGQTWSSKGGQTA